MRELAGYEQTHGRKPQVIALGKTHMEDLREYIQDGKFQGISMILHNDPFGVLFAHDNRQPRK